MKRNKIIISLALLSLLSLTSCGNGTSITTPSDKTDKKPIDYNSGRGLEGNQDADDVIDDSDSILNGFLNGVSGVSRYSYEVTSTVQNNEGHFTDYFDSKCWYNLDHEDDSASFGLALDENHKLFKYYLNDDYDPTPSLYQYTKYTTDGVTIDDTLYGPLNLATVGMLSTLDGITPSTAEVSIGTKVATNKYMLTSSDVLSVFQYMTTYGSSISSYITTCYINILDMDSLEFECQIDLGSYGSITGHFTDLTDKSSILDKTKLKLASKTLKGVEKYDDVTKFMNVLNRNNFTIKGYNIHISNGSELKADPYTVYCTNNYFYFDFNNHSYHDFGYVLVKKGTEVTYYSKKADYDYTKNPNDEYDKTKLVATTKTLNYDACYGFTTDNNGNLFFDYFHGPVETETTKYNEEYEYLKDIPESERKENVLYIVKEEGTNIKVVYEWKKSGDKETYSWARYSGWYNDVGAFYVNDIQATFYPYNMGITQYAEAYLEQSLTDSNYYHSNNSELMSGWANGLFGWGWQSSTNWMSSVKDSYIKLTKDSDGNITSGEVGLKMQANYQGTYGLHSVYYTYSNFGSTSHKVTETFLTGLGVSF